MLTVRQLLEEAVAGLRAVGVETPILDAELMMSGALACSRTEIITHSDMQPPQHIVDRFHDWVGRRSKREPLPYILGEREFYGFSFEVTPAVLIPRQETEFLVEAAVSFLPNRPSPAVADIGLGSGCVAIAIAKSVPGVIAYGTESSPDALAVACRNAERLGVLDQVRFAHGDLFGPLESLEFDMIVSNPPYIPSADIDDLQIEVRLYEPREALDGGLDGLDVIRRLTSEAMPYLKYGGALAVEIGIGESVAVECLFRSAGFEEVHTIKDYSGIERVVIGERR
jgi:release factor glutamine methyltransferase